MGHLIWLHKAFMYPEDADEMADSVDPDYTAVSGVLMRRQCIYSMSGN